MKSERFHPMRWRKTRRNAEQIIKVFGRRRIGTMLDMDGMNEIAERVMIDYNSDIMRLPFEKRPSNMNIVHQEVALSIVASRFFSVGMNIFALSPGLAQALGKTDLSGVRFGDIQLPFPSFYISLDGCLEAGLPGGKNVIDGAYVHQIEGTGLEFHITTRSTADFSARAGSLSDPYFYVPLKIDDQDVDFAQLLDEAVSSGQINLDDRLIDAAAEQVPEFDGAVDISKRSEAERARVRKDSMPAVREALSMIVNALAWLTATPEDVDDGQQVWPDDAPLKLREDVGGGKTKRQRQVARATLLSSGFTKIRILGSSIPKIDIGAGEGGDLRPHWRRGHWRRQPFGAIDAIIRAIRLMWIRPTIVRSDLGEPDQGHVYEIARPRAE